MLATSAMVPKTVKVGWNTVKLSFVEPSFIKESDCFGQLLTVVVNIFQDLVCNWYIC